ncbi:MAG: helix-turn-helix domain-containing protein [Bryobacteraceae bacterium]
MDARDNSAAGRASAVVAASLDHALSTGELARRAFQSRTQFHRVFRALIEETPAAMRRRLLLERAAWQLGRSDAPVTEVALDAQYGSLEAFSRAFRKAFGVSPSLYRRMGASAFRLQSASGIHFLAPGSTQKGALEMDLFDRFAGYDSWHTRHLLQHARQLTDEQLDRKIDAGVKLVPWEDPQASLRQLLDRIVQTKEVWTAALTGGPIPDVSRQPGPETTPATLLERFERADAAFERVLAHVRDHGGWDATFVDALCEPPETFTFGGMFAHVVTYNSYRRLMAASLMRQFGIEDVGFGDPIEYERSVSQAVTAPK